jgi:ribosomal protein S8
MIKSWIDIINELKIKKLAGKQYFYSKLSKKKKELLKIFLENNIILKIEIIEKNKKKYYKIFINNSLHFSINLLSRKNNINFITFKNLKKLLKKENTIYVLSTSSGVVCTNNLIDGNNVGGILLFSIT